MKINLYCFLVAFLWVCCAPQSGNSQTLDEKLRSAVFKNIGKDRDLSERGDCGGQLEDTREIESLIADGADVNIRDTHRFTPLMIAAWGGCPQAVKILADHGANIDLESDEGKTALMQAASWGCAECVQVLLDHGASVNLVDQEGTTALILAADHDQIQILKLLIDHGADVNATTKYKETALRKATRRNYVGTVTLLINHGANVDSRDESGTTALMDAARSADIEMVKTLIDHGANVHAQDHFGETVWDQAQERGGLERDGDAEHARRIEVLHILEAAGAKPPLPKEIPEKIITLAWLLGPIAVLALIVGGVAANNGGEGFGLILMIVALPILGGVAFVITATATSVFFYHMAWVELVCFGVAVSMFLFLIISVLVRSLSRLLRRVPVSIGDTFNWWIAKTFRITGGVFVGAGSFILALMFFFWFIPYLFTHGHLPQHYPPPRRR